MARFPKGTTGSQLDALARAPLWDAGLDFDHGTGHGVGSYLSVHEGPQRISKVREQRGAPARDDPVQRARLLQDRAYGIRIESLVVVTPLPAPPGGEVALYGFETLTLAPIDRALVDPDAPHPGGDRLARRAITRACERRSRRRSTRETAAWLAEATRPLARVRLGPPTPPGRASTAGRQSSPQLRTRDGHDPEHARGRPASPGLPSAARGTAGTSRRSAPASARRSGPSARNSARPCTLTPSHVAGRTAFGHHADARVAAEVADLLRVGHADHGRARRIVQEPHRHRQRRAVRLHGREHDHLPGGEELLDRVSARLMRVPPFSSPPRSARIVHRSGLPPAVRMVRS